MHGVYNRGWGGLAKISFKSEDFLKEPPTIEKGPWHERGIANAKVGNFNEAVNCFEMALEAEPDNATIWNDLGFVLRKLGNYRTAIDCFSKALEIRPGYSTAVENLEKANQEMRAQRSRKKLKTRR
jgi:tetratricopeptide (TPR) repeat protein